MRFLVDECLHTSLVEVAERHGHEAHHVNWLALNGAADWMLLRRVVTDDFTFVTNNAIDFRRLYRHQEIHAGLVIIVPNVAPALQRALFDALLRKLGSISEIVNEVIEISLDDGEVVFTRYDLPAV